MPLLNIDSLLQPVSADASCGEDLEYDAAFVSMDEASRGKPEQEYGDTIVPAEPPDWKEVTRHALDLSSRTKDLRVACLLARALLVTEGFTAFVEGLQLIRGYIDGFWDLVHPHLDPDDDNDPTIRVNILSSLDDFSTTIKALRETPLAASGILGTISLRDFDIAKGEIAPPADTEPPTMSDIEAAFADTSQDRLRELMDAAVEGAALADAVESRVTDYVGAANATSFDRLRNTLRDIQTVLSEHQSEVPEVQSEAEDGEQPEGPGVVAAPKPVSGEIHSRDDVMRMLDKLCQYYDRYEPSSPLPLFLRRAQRLVAMNFLDIIEELTPGALEEAKAVGGVRDE
ncbi:MAG: type VI secretion system protein TssA [Planctomycetaceae bacterium]|jgi:type VI secretion system protein ImpA|nr:type VI secretion system protein TssA [Planctomycetaceae bacterium]